MRSGGLRPADLRPSTRCIEQQVDVVAAEVRVAVGRQHLEHAVLDAQDRDVERAAAEVVDGDEAGVPLVEAVGQRRRRRLVDDAQHLEAGDAAGVARRGALRVVEVRRHGDHRAIDFVVELALLGEERLGAALQLAQDERGNFRRRELPVAEADPHDPAGFAARRGTAAGCASSRTSSRALAHEALHRIHGALRRRSAAAAAPRGRRKIVPSAPPRRPTAPARRRCGRG